MKIQFIFILVLSFLVVGCTNQEDISNSNQNLEDERELLEKVANEFLNESKKEDEEINQIQRTPIDNSNEENSITIKSSKGEVSEENESKTVESKSNIDIKVRDVDIDHSNSFDLDDEVEFVVDIETFGLEKDDFFLVEIIAIRKGEEENSCQFIYVVNNVETDEGCEMTNFERYGEYDVIVLADSKRKFDEDNEDNNQKRSDFELEE